MSKAAHREAARVCHREAEIARRLPIEKKASPGNRGLARGIRLEEKRVILSENMGHMHKKKKKKKVSWPGKFLFPIYP